VLSRNGGPLELRGSLLLQAPSNYMLKTRLKAREEAPDSLQKNLEFLGSADADGLRVFELSGSL